MYTTGKKIQWYIQGFYPLPYLKGIARITYIPPSRSAVTYVIYVIKYIAGIGLWVEQKLGTYIQISVSFLCKFELLRPSPELFILVKTCRKKKRGKPLKGGRFTSLI